MTAPTTTRKPAARRTPRPLFQPNGRPASFDVAEVCTRTAEDLARLGRRRGVPHYVRRAILDVAEELAATASEVIPTHSMSAEALDAVAAMPRQEEDGTLALEHGPDGGVCWPFSNHDRHAMQRTLRLCRQLCEHLDGPGGFEPGGLLAAFVRDDAARLQLMAAVFQQFARVRYGFTAAAGAFRNFPKPQAGRRADTARG